MPPDNSWHRASIFRCVTNRTCRFPASGSPTGFTARHTAGQLGQAFETQQAELSIDYVKGEPTGAAPCHFVPSGEEVAHALVDVSEHGALQLVGSRKRLSHIIDGCLGVLQRVISSSGSTVRHAQN